MAADAKEDNAPRLRAHLRRLRQRNVALDTAMILGALAGASTCGAAFSLFVGALRTAAGATGLFLLFGIALTCTVGALSAFIADSVLAWHGLHTEGPLPHMSKHQQWWLRGQRKRGLLLTRKFEGTGRNFWRRSGR